MGSMDTTEQLAAARPDTNRWVALAVSCGAAVAGVQALFVLFTIVQGLSLRPKADNFPSDVLHRVGIAFSRGVNMPSALGLIVAPLLTSVPSFVPSASGTQAALRRASLIVIEVVAVVVVGTIIG